VETDATQGAPPQYNGWSAWEDVDPFTSGASIVDNQVAILEYRNGARVTFHTNCCAAFPQRRMVSLSVLCVVLSGGD
jgi:hypothetical protein